jgi:hypothetical protein
MFIETLQYYARGNKAGEVWLGPAFLFGCPGLLGPVFAFLAILQWRASKDQYRGVWLALLSLVLTMSFPMSALFWGSFIRWVKPDA